MGAEFARHPDGRFAHAHLVAKITLQAITVQVIQLGNANFDLAGFGGNGRYPRPLGQCLNPQLIQQIIHRVRYRAKTVRQFGRHPVDFGQFIQQCHAPVQAQPQRRIRHIIGRHISRQRQIDQHRLRNLRRDGLARFNRPALLHRVGQQPRIQIKANGRNMTTLRRTQQIARAANLHVAHGDGIPGAQFRIFGQRLQARLGIGRNPPPWGMEKVGIGAANAPPHSSAKLIQLR